MRRRFAAVVISNVHARCASATRPDAVKGPQPTILSSCSGVSNFNLPACLRPRPIELHRSRSATICGKGPLDHSAGMAAVSDDLKAKPRHELGAHHLRRRPSHGSFIFRVKETQRHKLGKLLGTGGRDFRFIRLLLTTARKPISSFSWACWTQPLQGAFRKEFTRPTCRT